MPESLRESTIAFCPQCTSAMGSRETICKNCGYDFGPQTPSSSEGIFYSRLADFALIVGAFFAALGCLGAVLYTVNRLLAGDLAHFLIVGPIAFFIGLANMVVFIRVLKLGNRK